MYRTHFGLREPPFGITPDTSFAFSCAAHQEALNTLLVAVNNGEGFIKITGEVGTGKTLLCRRFLATLGRAFRHCLHSQSRISSRARCCSRWPRSCASRSTPAPISTIC